MKDLTSQFPVVLSQKVAAEGEGLIVYYDYRQGKSCKVPNAILSAINDLQSDYS
jgi:acyl-CoA thioesterase FadM